MDLCSPVLHVLTERECLLSAAARFVDQDIDRLWIQLLSHLVSCMYHFLEWNAFFVRPPSVPIQRTGPIRRKKYTFRSYSIRLLQYFLQTIILSGFNPFAFWHPFRAFSKVTM